jgi:hypothetical protein
MTAHTDAATEVCAVCGGPCLTPFRLSPVPESFPFLTAAQIAATQPPAPPAQAAPVARRGRRAGENRAHLPSEDR